MTTMNVQGVEVPTFLYGTAWKEERTEALVDQALAVGFRGIDTANQRKHYFEAGVGAALAKLSAAERAGIFLQSKFTHRDGQDHRLPYDPAADMATQVRQSFASSLEHLGVTRLDSLILHGPTHREGISREDREVWRTFEELHQEGRARLLGISNVLAGQLAELCGLARVKPAFVQNRCYARQGWDRQVREVCRREGVIYQGFSLLTANRAELQSRPLLAIAARHGKTPAQVVFAFARALGMIRLTGSSDAEHLRQDLESDAVELSLDGTKTFLIKRDGHIKSGSKWLAKQSIPVYTFDMEDPKRAKLFQNGGSQAVRLPRDCRFESQQEILIHREGRRVILEPLDEWPARFLSSLGAWDEPIERPAQKSLGELRDPFE